MPEPHAGILQFAQKAGEPRGAGEPHGAAHPRGSAASASFITGLTHSCCLPEAHTHTAGCCTPTQCHAVKLTTPLTPNTGSILFVSRRWRTLGFNVSCFSGDRWFNNYETYRNFHRCHYEKLAAWWIKPHMWHKDCRGQGIICILYKKKVVSSACVYKLLYVHLIQ